MPEWHYPTAFSYWSEEEHAAIARVIASGRFTMGAEVEAFEHEFAAFHGMKHGVMVNSGSSANLLAVAALFHKADDPLTRPRPDEIVFDERGSTGRIVPTPKLPCVVLVPALAWSTTYAPLVQHGLDLHLLDCDETWNAPVPEWYPKTNLRLIVACSILGNPGYLAEWQREAHKQGAYLIEDNCESFGAWARDGDETLCGTTGIMNTFSFFYSHQISAIEGGMILTNDAECARLCRVLRAHGWTRDVKKPERFEDEYDFELFGYNLRPLEMHAAVAREQLKKQQTHGRARRANALHFAALTVNLPITLPKSNGRINPFGLAFTCETQKVRTELAIAFRAEGIDCRLPTGGSFRMHPYGIQYAGQETPTADDVHRRGMFLGCAPYDISDKIERAVKVIRETL